MTLNVVTCQTFSSSVGEAIALFSRELKNPFDPSFSKTAEKVASIVKIALVNAFSRKEPNFEHLDCLNCFSVDLNSISKQISRLKDSENPNITLFLSLMQIFDLYTGFEHIRSREDLPLLDFSNVSLGIPNRTFIRVESLTASEDYIVANFFNKPSENIRWKAPVVLTILQKAVSFTKDHGDFSYLLKFYGHFNVYKISTWLEKNPGSVTDSLEEIIGIANTCKSLFALYEDIYSRIFFPRSISRQNDSLITLGNMGIDSVALDDDPAPFAKIMPFSSTNQKAIQIFSEEVKNERSSDIAFKTAAKPVLKLLHVAIFSHASLHGDFSFLLRFHSNLFDLEKLNEICMKIGPSNKELIADLENISSLYTSCLQFIRISRETTLRVLFPKETYGKGSELIDLGSHFDEEAAKSKFS